MRAGLPRRSRAGRGRSDGLGRGRGRGTTSLRVLPPRAPPSRAQPPPCGPPRPGAPLPGAKQSARLLPGSRAGKGRAPHSPGRLRGGRAEPGRLHGAPSPPPPPDVTIRPRVTQRRWSAGGRQSRSGALGKASPLCTRPEGSSAAQKARREGHLVVHRPLSIWETPVRVRPPLSILVGSPSRKEPVVGRGSSAAPGRCRRSGVQRGPWGGAAAGKTSWGASLEPSLLTACLAGGTVGRPQLPL